MSTKYAPQQKNVVRINFDLVGLGKRLDSEIARDLGIPRRRVTKERAKRKIEAFTKSNPGAKIARDRRVDAAQPATKPITQVIAETPVTAAPKQKPPKAEKPKKVRLKNYVAVVLDRSGSIGDYRLTDDVIRAYNNIVDDVKAKAKEHDQETSFNLFSFANVVTHDIADVDASRLSHMTRDSYHPGGGTALFDGVGAAIGYFKDRPDANDPNVSFLVLVITDGEENQSRTFRPERTGWAASSGVCQKLNDLIYEVQGTDRYTIVFQLPKGYKDRFVQNFKISNDNVREWTQTGAGVRELAEKTRGGISHFYTSRASGQTSVQNFFVTTDLSKVSVKDVRSKLDDISNKFKTFTVEKEMSVREFVEAKTKKPYVVGSAFYLLMKTEEIQPQKQVLIREKTKLAVWGGDEARKLIGLPQGAKAKVTPGNHSGFDVFVQSTSVNRLLPRGTTVLVDMTKLTNDKETWASGYTNP